MSTYLYTYITIELQTKTSVPTYLPTYFPKSDFPLLQSSGVHINGLRKHCRKNIGRSVPLKSSLSVVQLVRTSAIMRVVMSSSPD